MEHTPVEENRNKKLEFYPMETALFIILKSVCQKIVDYFSNEKEL